MRTTTSGAIEVVKFDQHFEPVECYTITDGKCDCPSRYQPCKHVKTFLPRFKAEGQINGTEYYEPNSNLFKQEINHAST